MQHSRGKPSLVFCSTRKGAQETALMLSETLSRLGNQKAFLSSEQYDRLQLAAQKTDDAHLQQCIPSGGFIGFLSSPFDKLNLIREFRNPSVINLLCSCRKLQSLNAVTVECYSLTILSFDLVLIGLLHHSSTQVYSECPIRIALSFKFLRTY